MYIKRSVPQYLPHDKKAWPFLVNLSNDMRRKKPNMAGLLGLCELWSDREWARVSQRENLRLFVCDGNIQYAAVCVCVPVYAHKTSHRDRRDATFAKPFSRLLQTSQCRISRSNTPFKGIWFESPLILLHSLWLTPALMTLNETSALLLCFHFLAV